MKKERTTLQEYKKYKRIDRGLKAGVVVTPTIPAFVITGINWQNWFGKAGVALPLGLSAVLASTVIAIIAVLRSDTVFKKKDLILLTIGLVFAVLGIVNMFFASIAMQLAQINFSIALACVASFVEFKVDVKAIQPKVLEYQELVETYALDPKSAAKKERAEKAKAEAEAKAKKEAEDKQKYGGLI